MFLASLDITSEKRIVELIIVFQETRMIWYCKTYYRQHIELLALAQSLTKFEVLLLRVDRTSNFLAPYSTYGGYIFKSPEPCLWGKIPETGNFFFGII